jgi:hypothetical protein
MRLPLLALLALVELVVVAPAPHASLLAGAAHDRVVQRTLLVVGQNPHGELVVLRRGEVTVVRTTLVSALLGRGLQSIRRKEQARWPEGAAGHDDSAAFLAALDAGEDAARDAWLHRKNPEDDRRKMMMELVLGARESFFAVYAIDAHRVGDAFEVTSATPVVVKDASRAYIEGAMRTQVGNGFKLTDEQARELLSRD